MEFQLKKPSQSMAEPAVASASRSSLSTMPPEIIRNILGVLLVRKGIICPNVGLRLSTTSLHDEGKYPFGSEKVLSIARACSYFTSLAVQTYYGKNTFMFERTSSLYHYLSRIGDRRYFMRNIKFRWEISEPILAFNLLSEIKGLRNLEIQVNRHTSFYTKGAQLDLFKAQGMKELRSTRGMTQLNLKVIRTRNRWGASEWYSDEHLKLVEETLQDEMTREVEELAENSASKPKCRRGTKARPKD